MIEGERIIIRALEREDLPRLVRWRNDPEARRFIFSYLPLSMEEEERWFSRYLEQEKNKVFIIEVKDKKEAIGYLLLSNIDHKNQNAEIGIHIDERDYQGKGYGKDAMRTFLRFLFCEMNLHRIYLYVHEYNERAIKFYRRMGFMDEGILRDATYTEGRFQNILLMSILRGEFGE
jgi:UDP-4-amino-4,6-dideoxy-N-acetyl-beta-L-altrosamine N-acetyltransferase